MHGFERVAARAGPAPGPSPRGSTAAALGFEDSARDGAPRTRSCARLLGDGRRARGRRRHRRGAARGQGRREVARMRAAAELADAALPRMLERGLAGRTEREVAIALEQAMRGPGRRGAVVPADRRVAAAHGALPHAVPRDVEIPRGRARGGGLGRAARRLLLRLHAHLRHRALGDERRRGLRARAARAAGRRSDAVRAGAEVPRRRRASRATSSRRPATASTSATASATASGWRSTRGRGWRRRPRAASPPATS